MAHRTAKVAAAAAGAVLLVGAVVALSSDDGDEEGLNPAVEAVDGLPTVSDFELSAEGGDCAFDEDRGGLVYEGLTVESRSVGVLELTFHAQRESLDDVLPRYVSTVLTFDGDSPRHTFDLVVPVTQEEYDAGYDECRFGTGAG